MSGPCLGPFLVALTKYLRLGTLFPKEGLVHNSEDSRSWHPHLLGSGESFILDGNGG
jgi:hypothetical protein